MLGLVVLDKYHWMLYFLTPAMYPRFLITLDEELNNVPVTVRVGQVSIFLALHNDSQLINICRLLTSLDKQANHGQSLASKHTKHLYD